MRTRRTAARLRPAWTRTLVFTATLAGLIGAIATAGAGSRHRQAPRPSSARMIYAPVSLPRPPRGPPWAMPNECYIDEGYGRFSPCR